MGRLDNARWGFESSCFVCEPSNPTGLQIPFFHDEERGRVVADINLTEAFSGAPSYVHGGISLALLDEAMAWAAIAIGGRFAVTRDTSARFAYPVHVGRPYRVEAWITDASDRRIEAEAHLLDSKDRPCVTAAAIFVPLGPAEAARAVGSEVTGADAAFVRPDPA